MTLLNQLSSHEGLTEVEFSTFAASFLNERILPIQSSLVFLSGNLGVGKTAFVAAALRQLQINASSPTFPIVNTYRFGNRSIIHIDLYRMERIYSLNELFNFDAEADSAIIFVEWPEKLINIEKKIDFWINININPSNSLLRDLLITY